MGNTAIVHEIMRAYTRIHSSIPGIVGVLVGFLLPSLANAHIGVGQTSGLAHGIAHPFTGLDHIVAMMAVGLWAAQCGDRAVWVVPVSFVAAMSVGGVIGAVGIAVPFVEPGIAASVLVLGLLIATATRLPLIASIVLVGLFAVCHGHAHGTEMPESATGLAYGFGFAFSTGLLHGLGIVLGLAAQRLFKPHLLQYVGGAAVVYGFYLFIA